MTQNEFFQVQKDLMLKSTVHAADLSNPVLKADLYHAWAYKVGEQNSLKFMKLHVVVVLKFKHFDFQFHDSSFFKS